jgi:hypothetical protein
VALQPERCLVVGWRHEVRRQHMRYEFRVDGRLPDEARDALVGMRIKEAPVQTVIDGDVLDESQLHGIIIQLQTLGITVVSVQPIPG